MNKSHTALLVMDMQTDILAGLGDKAAPLVERIATAIGAARAAKRMVLYVVVGFRPGYPELDRSSPMYTAVAKAGRLQTTTPGSDIVQALRPLEHEVVVQKHRVGAFSGTDLDMILRANGIDTLVLTGIATSGVILSTVRHGFDADYKLVVVEDCCADADEEVHRVLTTKVLSRQAKVIQVSELAMALE